MTEGEDSNVLRGHIWAENAYSNGDFPFIVVKRTVAGKPLMSSNFTSMKCLDSASAEASSTLGL